MTVAFGGARSFTFDSLIVPRSPSAPIDWSTAQLCQATCGLTLTSTAGVVSVVGRTVSFHAADSYSGEVAPIRIHLRDVLGYRATATISIVVTRPTAPKVTSAHHYVALGSMTTFHGVVTTSESVVLDPLTICLSHDASCPAQLTTPRGRWELTNGVVTYTALKPTRSCVDVVVTDVAQRVTTGRLCAEVPAPPVGALVNVRTPYDVAITADPVASVTRGRANIPVVASTLELEGGVKTLTRAEGTFRVVNGRVQFIPAVSFGGQSVAVGYEVANEIGQRASGTVRVRVGTPPSPIARSATLAVLPGGTATKALVGLPGALVSAASPQLCLVTSTGCHQSVLSSTAVWAVSSQAIIIAVRPVTPRGATFSVRYRVTDIVGRQAEGVVTAQVVGPAVLTPITSTVPPRTSTLVPNEPSQPLAPWQRGSWQLCQGGADQGCDTSLTVAGAGTVSISSHGILTVRPVPGFHGSLGSLWLRASDTQGQVATAPLLLTVR